MRRMYHASSPTNTTPSTITSPTTMGLGPRLACTTGSAPAAPATPAQPAAGFVPQAPPWMEVALREQGVTEWNPGDNPRIIETRLKGYLV